MATFENTYYRVDIVNTYIQIGMYGIPSGEEREVLIEEYLFQSSCITRVIFDDQQQFGIQLLDNPNRVSFFFDPEGLSLQRYIDGATSIPFTYQTLKEYLTKATSI